MMEVVSSMLLVASRARLSMLVMKSLGSVCVLLPAFFRIVPRGRDCMLMMCFCVCWSRLVNVFFWVSCMAWKALATVMVTLTSFMSMVPRMRLRKEFRVSWMVPLSFRGVMAGAISMVGNWLARNWRRCVGESLVTFVFSKVDSSF